MYVFDDDGVNVTLQTAAAIITESMNRLATDGVFVRDVDGGNVSWLTLYQGETTFESLRGFGLVYFSSFSMAPKIQQGHQMESLGHELQRGLEIYGTDVQPLQHTLQREGPASQKND